MKGMMGFGYPSRLQGEKIPYLARIVAVADAFDAMTSQRTYRKAIDLEVVKSEIEKNRRAQFDPQIADIFLDILNKHFGEIEEIQKKYA